MSHSGPRALVVGDPHFKPKNVSDVEVAIRESLRICRQVKPDFVVLLGDILDTHEVVYTQAYRRACLWIEMLSRLAPVYVLMGNHDYINQTQFLTDEHIFGALKFWPNVTIVDHVMATTIGNQLFVFTPYVEPGRLGDALATLTHVDWTLAHTLFAHQEFRGVKMGHITSVEGDDWDATWPNVITGHIHETQIIEPKIYYPGSMMQHAQGDMSFKSLWEVTFLPDGSLDIQPHVMSGIKSRKTIDLTMAEVYTWDLSLADEYHVRLRITCSDEEKSIFLKSQRLQELTAKGVQPKYITPKVRHTHERVTMGRDHASFRHILHELIQQKSPAVQDMYAQLVSQGLLQ